MYQETFIQLVVSRLPQNGSLDAGNVMVLSNVSIWRLGRWTQMNMIPHEVHIYDLREMACLCV